MIFKRKKRIVCYRDFRYAVDARNFINGFTSNNKPIKPKNLITIETNTGDDLNKNKYIVWYWAYE